MQPARGNYFARCFLVNKEAGELCELEDPVTGNITRAKTLDMYRYTIRELPDSICYITYGLSGDKVKSAILSRYPGLTLDSEIEVLILQKLEEHD